MTTALQTTEPAAIEPKSYRVAVGYYVHAYTYKTIEAATDAEAIESAKRAAVDVMNSCGLPEDTYTDDEKWEGKIGFIDRIDDPYDDERETVAEDVYFDDNMPLAIISNAAAMLREAVDAWPQFDTDHEQVSGADLVEWFAAWRERARVDCASAMAATAPLGPVAIVIEGGLVSSVCTKDKRLHGVQIAVIDYDADGMDDDEIETVLQGDGTESEASVRVDQIEPAEIDISRFFDGREV